MITTKSRSITIYEADIRRILQLRTRSARMLAFLLTAFIDAYGFCSLSQASICEMIGVKSDKTVYSAEQMLLDYGFFAKFPGNLGHTTNKYKFHEEYEAERRNGKSIVLQAKIRPDTFYVLYLSSLWELGASEKGFLAALTSREIKDMKRLVIGG